MTRPGEGPGPPAAAAIIAPKGYAFDASDRLLDWPNVVGRLAEAQTYWLITVPSLGPPHATPIWGVWLGNLFFFNGRRQAKWARNVATNPHVALHLGSTDEVAVVEGRAEAIVTSPATGALLRAAWLDKYGAPAPAPDIKGLYRLTPTKARAWERGLKRGTSWTFQRPRGE